MTRKDYIAIARVLACARPANEANIVAHQTWRQVREGLMKVCENDNTRFDRQRFVEATEVRPS